MSGPDMQHRDYPPEQFTNGELRAMLGPVFGLNHENLEYLVIVAVHKEGWVGVHSMADPAYSIQTLAMQDIAILSGAISNIVAVVRESQE